MFYYIFLKPNHTQHNIALIGVSENPEIDSRKWLAKRTQFEVLSADTSTGYINCLQLNQTILTEEQEEKYKNIKHYPNNKLYHHRITWKEVTQATEVYISLERGDYLSL